MFLSIIRIIDVLLTLKSQQIKANIEICFLSFKKFFKNLTTMIFFVIW